MCKVNETMLSDIAIFGDMRDTGAVMSAQQFTEAELEQLKRVDFTGLEKSIVPFSMGERHNVIVWRLWRYARSRLVADAKRKFGADDIDVNENGCIRLTFFEPMRRSDRVVAATRFLRDQEQADFVSEQYRR